MVMQWISHCVQLQIDSVGVFCLGSGPVFCVWFVFCCLLRCFRWRNASLAGGFAGRRLWCVCGFRFVVTSICLFHGLFVLVQSLVCLLTCKDRAISATSATLEEKKLTGASLMRGRLLGIGSGCTRHPSKKYIPDKGRIF